MTKRNKVKCPCPCDKILGCPFQLFNLWIQKDGQNVQNGGKIEHTDQKINLRLKWKLDKTFALKVYLNENTVKRSKYCRYSFSRTLELKRKESFY